MCDVAKRDMSWVTRILSLTALCHYLNGGAWKCHLAPFSLISLDFKRERGGREEGREGKKEERK